MYTRKKLLIAGDSFASDMISQGQGWPDILAQHHDVTNVARPGIGEYKILQSLLQQDFDQYDRIIVSHTSPNRVHTEINPMYPSGHVYHASDLIFSDVESKASSTGLARSMHDYFKYVFDPVFYQYVYDKCCQDIVDLDPHHKMIHITHFPWTSTVDVPGLINFYDVWLDNKGPYAHYNHRGTDLVSGTLRELLADV